MERRASTARETAYLPFLIVPHAQQPLVDAVFYFDQRIDIVCSCRRCHENQAGSSSFPSESRGGRLKVDPSIPKTVTGNMYSRTTAMTLLPTNNRMPLCKPFICICIDTNPMRKDLFYSPTEWMP